MFTGRIMQDHVITISDTIRYLSAKGYSDFNNRYSLAIDLYQVVEKKTDIVLSNKTHNILKNIKGLNGCKGAFIPKYKRLYVFSRYCSIKLLYSDNDYVYISANDKSNELVRINYNSTDNICEIECLSDCDTCDLTVHIPHSLSDEIQVISGKGKIVSDNLAGLNKLTVYSKDGEIDVCTDAQDLTLYSVNGNISCRHTGKYFDVSKIRSENGRISINTTKEFVSITGKENYPINNKKCSISAD